MTSSGAMGVVGAVTARPGLWPAALRQLIRLAAPGWWRRAPFLPLPATDYVKWRLHTAYGDEGTVPPASDIVRLARWAARPW